MISNVMKRLMLATAEGFLNASNILKCAGNVDCVWFGNQRQRFKAYVDPEFDINFPILSNWLAIWANQLAM